MGTSRPRGRLAAPVANVALARAGVLRPILAATAVPATPLPPAVGVGLGTVATDATVAVPGTPVLYEGPEGARLDAVAPLVRLPSSRPARPRPRVDAILARAVPIPAPGVPTRAPPDEAAGVRPAVDAAAPSVGKVLQAPTPANVPAILVAARRPSDVDVDDGVDAVDEAVHVAVVVLDGHAPVTVTGRAVAVVGPPDEVRGRRPVRAAIPVVPVPVVPVVAGGLVVAREVGVA